MLIITKDNIKPEFKGKIDHNNVKLHHLTDKVQEKIRLNRKSLVKDTVYFQVISITNICIPDLN